MRFIAKAIRTDSGTLKTYLLKENYKYDISIAGKMNEKETRRLMQDLQESLEKFKKER